MKKILAINQGATSTKFAVFANDQVLLKKTVEHQGNELNNFPRIYDQQQYRLGLILAALDEANIAPDSFDAIVGRGGLLKPLAGGTYAVNNVMIEDLKKSEEHASKLGGLLGYTLGQQLGIPAYIVDPVSVDELEPVARVSGSPEFVRISMS
ncbi:MAG: butyrate kinase, partial [Caproiciproducens sp.]|nr:butyrate kinase [Caproiciproducens sp.]